MATLKQINASRHNGAKSKGPITPAGLEKSSRNSLKHGFSSKLLMLSNEDQEFFDQILAEYTETLAPVNIVERDLVFELCSIRWRQRRLWAAETALLDDQMTRIEADIKDTYENSIDEPTVVLSPSSRSPTRARPSNSLR